MKRIRFFLIATALLPLLCICQQGWWAVEVGLEADAVQVQTSVPLNQQPLGDERHYAEDAMQCAISVSPFSTKLTKWGETFPVISSANENWYHGMKKTAKSGHHFSSLLDGRSVVIRLHHLII